jgi:peptidoglycan/xylan/chitin deacetylase (PgdA/CDA1 family)
MPYLTYTPWWLRKLYPTCIWQIPTKEKVVYLTFDDGPNPLATPFVLEQLRKYNAKGTFFCIGKNVVQHPDIFSHIKNEGHEVGNHTMHHANGWKTENQKYLHEIKQADAVIHSNLFRPPYGRIKKAQIKLVNGEWSMVNGETVVDGKPFTIHDSRFTIIMWSVLSGDFDTNIDGFTCFQNVINHVKPGSIIVFHDSEKAFPRLQIALPKTLEWLTKQGFRCEALFL